MMILTMLSLQLLVSGDVMPGEKLPELIAGLTTADVQAAAMKLSSASSPGLAWLK